MRKWLQICHTTNKIFYRAKIRIFLWQDCHILKICQKLKNSSKIVVFVFFLSNTTTENAFWTNLIKELSNQKISISDIPELDNSPQIRIKFNLISSSISFLSFIKVLHLALNKLESKLGKASVENGGKRKKYVCNWMISWFLSKKTYDSRFRNI